MTTTTKAPRKRSPKTSKPTPAPKCECGKELDWRDAMYGRGGRCKRCTARSQRGALRGRFIPAAEYVAMLAKPARRGRPA